MSDSVQQDLAYAVITRAIEDARKFRMKNVTGRDAVFFLKGTSQAWDKSFKAWCDIAKIEPEALRDKLKKEKWFTEV